MLFSENRSVFELQEQFSFIPSQEDEDLKSLDFFKTGDELNEENALSQNFADLFSSDNDEEPT